MKNLAAAILASVTACGAVPTVTHSASIASSAGTASSPAAAPAASDWVLSCPNRPEACAASAKQRCPIGYVVLDDAGKPIAVWLSDVAPSMSGGQLHGRCIERLIQEELVPLPGDAQTQ